MLCSITWNGTLPPFFYLFQYSWRYNGVYHLKSLMIMTFTPVLWNLSHRSHGETHGENYGEKHNEYWGRLRSEKWLKMALFGALLTFETVWDTSRKVPVSTNRTPFKTQNTAKSVSNDTESGVFLLNLVFTGKTTGKNYSKISLNMRFLWLILHH